MKTQITVHNLDHIADMIRREVSEKMERLGTYYDQIMNCRVVVDAPHRHQHEGVLYEVHIEMRVPGAELIVKRQPNENLDIAIRDAFDTARRQLEDYARRHRGDVKHHEEALPGEITKLFPDQGFGFLTTADGLEIYFHEHSVINRDFKHLQLGTKVHFVEEEGEKGPQASTVTVID